MRSVLVLALLLTGCATTGQVWRNLHHEDAGRFTVEQMGCQQHAAATAPYQRSYNPLVAGLVGQRQAQYDAAYADCMNRLGYYLSRQ